VVTWDDLLRRSALYFAVVTLRRSATGALLTFGPEGPSDGFDRGTRLLAHSVIRSIPRALTRVRVERSKWGLTLPATASTRQAFRAYSRTAAEPPELHVRRPNLSLDDLLRFVIAPLHVTLGGLIGCLRRF
jgi:hypothetical protein